MPRGWARASAWRVTAEDLPTVQRSRLGQGYAEPVAAKKKRAAPREGAALQDHDEGNETTGGRSR